MAKLVLNTGATISAVDGVRQVGHGYNHYGDDYIAFVKQGGDVYFRSLTSEINMQSFVDVLDGVESNDFCLVVDSGRLSKVLYALQENTGDEKLTIEIVGERLILRCGEAKVALQVLSENINNIAGITSVEKPTLSFVASTQKFYSIVNELADLAAKHKTYAQMFTYCINIKRYSPDAVKLTCGDGHRLVEAFLEVSDVSETGNNSINLYAEYALIIAKRLRSTGGYFIAKCDNSSFVVNDHENASSRYKIATQLVACEYPETSGIFKVLELAEVRVGRKELSAIIDYALSIDDPENAIDLKLSQGRLTLVAESRHGEAEIPIPSTVDERCSKVDIRKSVKIDNLKRMHGIFSGDVCIVFSDNCIILRDANGLNRGITSVFFRTPLP